MKLKTLVSVMCLSAISFGTLAEDNLVSQAQTDSRQQQAHNVQREAGFKQTEQQLRAEKSRLTAQRDALQAQADKLAAQFSKNENTLSHLEEKLRLETGSLGEIFGVVRQNAKEIQSELRESVTGTDSQHYAPVIDDIVAAKSLPSMKQLVGLWKGIEEQIHASGEAKTVSIPLIDGEGRTHDTQAMRLGAMGLITDQGYVQWNNQRGDAVAYPKQPDNAPTLESVQSLLKGEMTPLVVDPSRGTLLEQLAHTPSLTERMEAGGVIGYIILVLLAIGLIIAVYRGVVLAAVRQKIKVQLRNPHKPGDNPLGRVLAVYNKEQSRSVEALELRLLEAVVDEQSGLERGLSMLKLFAALAPMLGLLGTVTGMIETFQVITQFGNGDPKVMAGGISMALVTTVLGLVAAMPLLLAHNILSSQAEIIRNILEKQGIGLVAEEAEKESASSHRSTPVGNAA